MKERKPIIHGRDHLPGGADPIPADMTLNAIIDGGGTAITTGVKGDVVVDRRCRIVAWTLLADSTGSAVVDVWKAPYGGFPPTDADSITGGDEPELATADSARDTSLSTWDTDVASGDVFRFNVDSVTGVTQLTLALTLRPV